DPYLPAFEVMIPGLVEAYDRSAPQNAKLKEAIEVLRNWEFAVSKESVAMSLAHFYGMECLRSKQTPQDLNYMQRKQYWGEEAPFGERLEAFGAAVAKLEQDFGTWNTPWGEINRFQRLNGDIDLQFDDDKPSIAVGMSSATWGALAAYGMRSAQQTKKIYGTRGNSFVAVVEFGDKVKAKSLLAGGQSGDPNSPHFMDQAQLYADQQFKDVAYYREEVEKRAERTYHPGELD
ncbi:MAG: penicillin acylase family protein, partial [Bacteroidota bacterium]